MRIFGSEEAAEEREKLENELRRFEEWTRKVCHNLGNPEYEASYDELRFAVKIIGIRATVYPKHGNHPFRWQVVTRPPKIMDVLNSIADGR